MPNLSDDEHDEDDLPNISNYIVQPPRRPPTSTLTSQRKADENLLDRFQNSSFNRSTEKWRELQTKSDRAARDDDDDDEPVIEENVQEFRMPSYPPVPPVRPPSRATSTPSRFQIRSSSPSPPPRPRSPSPPPTPPRLIRDPTPYEQKPLDSKKSESKWVVRLPHLISVSVGPDRQKLEKTRRHTTEIVYQKSNGKNEDFYLSNSSTRANGTLDERMKINPLVKQLREKFNRIAEKTASESVAVRTSSIRPRVNSFIDRRTTTNGNNSTTREWTVRPSDTLLPRRRPLDVKPSLSNGPTQRKRPGPPVSYPKQYYPPPSTVSVIKQLIDSGATLIYDSSDRNSSRQGTTSTSLYKFAEVDLNSRVEALKETNLTLTGRQMSSNVDEDDYATITPQIRQETNDDNDQSDQTVSRHGSHSDTLRPVTQSENNEDTAYYAVFDVKP